MRLLLLSAVFLFPKSRKYLTISINIAYLSIFGLSYIPQILFHKYVPNTSCVEDPVHLVNPCTGYLTEQERDH